MSTWVLDPANYLVNPYSAAPALVGALTAGMGLGVLFRERGSFISWLFFSLTFLGAVWLFGQVGGLSARTLELAMFWIRVEKGAVVFLPVMMYAFSLAITENLKRSYWVLAALLANSVLFGAALVMSDGLVSGAHVYPWGYYARHGPLGVPFMVFFGGLLVASLRMLYRECERTEGLQRERLRTLMYAFAAACIASIDFLPAYGIPVFPTGFIPVCAFLALAGKAVWRYRLVAITPAFAAAQILSTINDAVVVFDQQGIVQIANPAACELSESPQLVGKHVSALGADFLPRRHLSDLLRTGSAFCYETCWINARGRRREMEVSISAVRDPTGQIVGVVCFAHDMTERKQAQKQLEAAREYAENIVDTIREPLVVLDTHLRVQSANRAFYQKFQTVPSNTVGRCIYDLTDSPWNTSKMRALLETLPKDTLFENVELEYEFPSVGRRTLLINAIRLYHERAESNQILLAMEDITERKEWERKLVQQSHEIMLSEETLRKQTQILESILASIGEGVVVADISGKFLVFNPAAEKLLGIGPLAVPPEQWTAEYGCYLSDGTTPYPPDHLPLVRAMRGEEVTGEELYIQNKRKPNGLWLLITARPVTDHAGELRGGVVVFHDVSERKRAQQALQSAYRKLRETQQSLIQAEKLSALGRFSAGLAHEIKNPLGIILGGIEYLQDLVPRDDSKAQMASEAIRDSVHRADAIVHGLLRFSTPSPMERETLKPETLVDEALALIRYRVSLSNITVQAEHSPDPLPVHVDKNQLQQVLFNVFANAIEAMPEGGTLRIRTGAAPWRVSPRARHCMIEITDTGVGIPPEQMNRLFEPFFTTKRNQKGTGLGLSISRMIVENHGGKLKIESQVGRGTCARILLPVAEEAPCLR